mmetsp:Transcript_35020/g.69185  ORF Transcript_35020/g.69185 Transcript_35020/m.69185 type:complete len:212 (+) Transcript_35020:540-1175(+)
MIASMDRQMHLHPVLVGRLGEVASHPHRIARHLGMKQLRCPNLPALAVCPPKQQSLQQQAPVHCIHQVLHWHNLHNLHSLHSLRSLHNLHNLHNLYSLRSFHNLQDLHILHRLHRLHNSHLSSHPHCNRNPHNCQSQDCWGCWDCLCCSHHSNWGQYCLDYSNQALCHRRQLNRPHQQQTVAGVACDTSQKPSRADCLAMFRLVVVLHRCN